MLWPVPGSLRCRRAVPSAFAAGAQRNLSEQRKLLSFPSKAADVKVIPLGHRPATFSPNESNVPSFWPNKTNRLLFLLTM